jgi:uncharacterized protein GlcG (DUF336 family)
MVIGKLAALFAATVAISFSASAQSSKALTVDLAQAIAQESMAACRGNGFKVSVIVVDSGNFVKAILRDDGARPATVEIGRMKAYTVIVNAGAPSGPPANLPAGQPVPAPLVPGTVNVMGGVPIKVGDELVGAVAVSGAPGGEKDAACANTALAKVADKLK